MQNGVTLETSEKDLKVIFGPFNSSYDDDDRVLALASLKFILSDMNDIRTRYINLGFHLYEFSRCGHFFKFGYATMEGFCAANLGLDKSAVSRCISVWKNFAAVEGCSRKMWLDDRYKDYSYSQLCEMVSMDDVQRANVRPDMTIKQIREVKKGNVSQNVSQVATSQPKKEKFHYGDYISKHGVVLYNYIKNLVKEKTCGITIFDQNGKEVYYNVVEFLADDTGGLYFRLREDDKKSFPESV